MPEEKNLEDCCFCSEFGPDSHGNNQNSRVVAWSKHSVAFPSLGALTLGHLLIVPREHWTSLRLMPAHIFDDILGLRDRLAALIRNALGPLVQFEHGAPPFSQSGCGINHAHLHLIPMPTGIAISEALADLNSVPLSSLSQIRETKVDEPYLYLEESSGEVCLFSASSVPSQYLRRVIAERLGLPVWDWRARPYNEIYQSTLQFYLEAGYRHE